LSESTASARPTFCNWKTKYGRLDVSQLRRLKELESENSKLKKMYAELSLAQDAFKDVEVLGDLALRQYLMANSP
jgi:hypothetical protein